MDSENNSSVKLINLFLISKIFQRTSLTGIHLAASKMGIYNSDEFIRPVQIFKLCKDRHFEFTGQNWLQQFLNAPENREKLVKQFLLI